MTVVFSLLGDSGTVAPLLMFMACYMLFLHQILHPTCFNFKNPWISVDFYLVHLLLHSTKEDPVEEL